MGENMRELISQSLSGIRDMIPGQNYGIIKARLDQLLPKEAASSFAKVEIQGKDGIWYAENNLPYKVYSEASEQEKEEIAIELEKLKEIAHDKLKDEMPYWENLFVVPDEDCIYWAKEGDKMNVVLAEWGFEIRTTEKQVNVISEIITAPRRLIQPPVVPVNNVTTDQTAGKCGNTIKPKKRGYLWLWPLLLAVFFGLCCIRCSHDITVHVVDDVTGEPITSTSVTLEYTEHALCKGICLFYTKRYIRTLETDDKGDVVFYDMPCSVFSYIFYAFSDAYLRVDNDSHYLQDAPMKCLFHYTWDATLKLQPNTLDVQNIAPQDEIDLPPEIEVLPCDGGIEIDHAVVGDKHQRTYGLGRKSGTTTISIDFDGMPDSITVYDGPNTSYPIIVPKTSYTFKNTIPITFSHGYITVVMEGSTCWKYIVNCPD